MPNSSLYSATKGAIDTITVALAKELVAPVVVFLASDDAAWITGERISASGGLH